MIADVAVCHRAEDEAGMPTLVVRGRRVRTTGVADRMNRTKGSQRRLLSLLLVVALASAIGACGDDEDAADGRTGTSVAAADGDLATYCATTLEIETLQEPEIDFEAMSSDEAAQAAARYASDELVPRAEKARATAPAEVRPEIDVLADAVAHIAETGDFATFQQPEVEAASAAAHAYDVEHCGWQTVAVRAVEYEFEGIEDSYEAGPISFEVTNAGAELHELVLLRKKEGTSESYEQLLEMPEAEAQTKLDTVGGTFVERGETGYFVADLDGGEYLAVCFIPVGLTSDGAESGEQPKGPPHFTRGMRTIFSVS